MINTFRAYDPTSLHSKAYSTACEACYSRKVKCELLEGGASCKQCADHGVECKPRTRKRKAQSIDGGQRPPDEGQAGVFNAPTNTSGRRDEYSIDPAVAATAGQKRRTSNNHTHATPKRPPRSESAPSVPDLFVNRDSGSAFSPESPETETTSQDRFRNASYLSRSAILGEDFPNIDHTHAERVAKPDKVSSTELKVLRLQGAFELPELPLRQALVEAFLERSHTWNPVVDQANITRASTTGDGSLLLLQAILLVGSLMRPDACGKGFSEKQYLRVKALLHSGYERNPLNILAALCLVQWNSPSAPKDISMDIPRSWNTSAIELAQQMGLQRPPPAKEASNAGLRNRIWWTLVARDNLTSSAHGRPRIIQPIDCTVPFIRPTDFENPADVKSSIFIYYVAITRILSDLCLLVTRSGEATATNKYNIALRLKEYIQSLPDYLRLCNPDGTQNPYSYEIAQLHVPILTTMIILYRPQTIFHLTAANAASTTAAFLCYRIFQAIQFREQTRTLSSAFAWHLLVTAIPLLSCTKVLALSEDANEALDTLETVLETLGTMRPAAANNLRSVQAIRKAMDSKSGGPASSRETPVEPRSLEEGVRLSREVLQCYGLEAIRQHDHVAEVLGAHCNAQADRSAAHALSSLCGRPTANPFDHHQHHDDGSLTPGTDAHGYIPGFEMNEQDAVTTLFEDDTLGNSWMMKDWMDELQAEKHFWT